MRSNVGGTGETCRTRVCLGCRSSTRLSASWRKGRLGSSEGGASSEWRLRILPEPQMGPMRTQCMALITIPGTGLQFRPPEPTRRLLRYSPIYDSEPGLLLYGLMLRTYGVLLPREFNATAQEYRSFPLLLCLPYEYTKVSTDCPWLSHR